MGLASRPSILLVENNPEVGMLTEGLIGETFSVTSAASAEEALSVLSSGEQFDLFLLDIRLGEGKDGVELLRLLRDLGPTASVPAVALTTYGGTDDI